MNSANKDSIRVLIVQNNAILNNKNANFDIVEKLVESYIDEKMDLMILPEVWAVGWDCQNFQNVAEDPENSETLDFIKHLASKHKTMIAGGSFITKTKNGQYKNTLPIVTKEGRVLALYDKMHLFSHKGSSEEKFVSQGENLITIDLGYTKIGLSVCYDIRFPELFREYSKNGVEVFINTAAWGRNKLMHWETMQKARAIENQCYMIAADQTGKIQGNEYNLGHSMVISPWGDIIGELGEEEACIFAELDLNKLRKLRDEFPLLKDRRNEEFIIKTVKENN